MVVSLVTPFYKLMKIEFLTSESEIHFSTLTEQRERADFQYKISRIQTKMQVSAVESKKLRKVSCLGGGTYGRVYQAVWEDDIVQPTPGSLIFVDVMHPRVPTFAVKRNFISSSLDGSIGSVRELDLLNLVKSHPYCISLKDVSMGSPFHEGSLSPSRDLRWISDKVFFVLEKGELDGTKYIYRLSRPGPKPGGLINERKLFMVQIALAVEFLHSRGVYHRDLKPANIICFTDSNGELESAKLTDFGLAQYYTLQTMSLPGFVTPWYRAPEISLTKEYDYKVDVWSLGCILFELFSVGNRPFINPSNDEALINALIERVPFPREYYHLARQLYPKKITRSYDTFQKALQPLSAQFNYTESQITQFNSSQLGGQPNLGSFDELSDLIEKMLEVNPSRRWTVSQCLNHSFFRGYRDLINTRRVQFGINEEGTWITSPEPILRYFPGNIRDRAAVWFHLIYSNRLNETVSKWFSYRIFFHALEMFDRYLYLTEPEFLSEPEIVVAVNTLCFIAAKFFRIMVPEYGLDHFCIGIQHNEFPIFKERAQLFEERLIEDIFHYELYKATVYEVAEEFINEQELSAIIRSLLKGELPSGIPLRLVRSTQERSSHTPVIRYTDS